MPKRQPAQQQPHFTIEVQPRAVATELAALPDNAEVSYSSNVAGWLLSGSMRAKDLRAQIEAIIKRQRQGHYTLTEAAQVISDARGGNPESHLARLQQGWADERLPVHQGGSRYLRRPEETICTFDDTVTVHDLNKWLQDQTGRGFPGAAVSVGCEAKEAGSDASEPKVHSTKDKRRRDDLWPVIEEAQRKCYDPKDTAAVWGELKRMADHETGPLLAFTGQGIKWTRNGKTAYLTRDALHKRLNPETRRCR